MDERDAVERLRRGDIGGLEALVRRYYLRAGRTAYLIVRDHALAEDVAQDAFVRAFERIGQYDAERPFAPWFMRIVVNGAVEAARGRERTSSYDDGEVGALMVRFADPAPGPHELAERAEQREGVWTAMEKLPPRQRAAVVQRYYLDMSETEMSEASGSPPGTIKSRLHAARRRLRRLLYAQAREDETPESREQPVPTSVPPYISKEERS